MKIKTPASKTQIRLLQLVGITEKPTHYVQAGEWLSSKYLLKNALPLGMSWREVGKLSDEEYLAKCQEWRVKQEEKAEKIDMQE